MSDGGIEAPLGGISFKRSGWFAPFHAAAVTV